MLLSGRQMLQTIYHRNEIDATQKSQFHLHFHCESRPQQFNQILLNALANIFARTATTPQTHQFPQSAPEMPLEYKDVCHGFKSHLMHSKMSNPRFILCLMKHQLRTPHATKRRKYFD